MIRLIAADLDGTLLDENHELPAGVFDVILALREKGVGFAAASGRQYHNLRRLFYPVRDKIHYICENGALVVCRGKAKPCFFDAATAREIIKDILSAGMELLISSPDHCCVLQSASRAYTDDIIYRLKNTTAVLEDPFQAADECIKISGFHPCGVKNLAPALQEKWGKAVHCDVAGENWLDFTLTNKGSGIQALSRELGVSLSDIAAFGDQFNDESMLSLAGRPYIMAHAPKALLEKGFERCEKVMPVLVEILNSL